MNNSCNVVITGMGAISPIGNDLSSFFQALIQPRSGIKLSQPDISIGLTALPIGEVTLDSQNELPMRRGIELERTSQLGLAAAYKALQDSGLNIASKLGVRASITWGTGMGGSSTLEMAYRDLFIKNKKRVRPTTVAMVMNNATAFHIASAFGIEGESLTISTACSSSTIAIGEAYRMIRQGRADIVVAGGADSMLNPCTLRAWQMMGVLSNPDSKDPSRSCRPFSLNRSGLVMAEAGAALILESEDLARARGAHIYAYIAGYGTSTDPTHLTSPTIHGQVQTMRLALSDAKISPVELDYINAHGTATLVGDQIEAASIAEVISDQISRVAVSATKAVHGHTMGAGGALECIATALTIQERVIPPTAYLDQQDPEFLIDFVPQIARPAPSIRYAMSNSFAFGGVNACIVLKSAYLGSEDEMNAIRKTSANHT